jgi:hypothetical protein
MIDRPHLSIVEIATLVKELDKASALPPAFLQALDS